MVSEPDRPGVQGCGVRGVWWPWVGGCGSALGVPGWQFTAARYRNEGTKVVERDAGGGTRTRTE